MVAIGPAITDSPVCATIVSVAYRLRLRPAGVPCLLWGLFVVFRTCLDMSGRSSAIVGGGQPRKKMKTAWDSAGSSQDWIQFDDSWSSVPTPPPPPARQDAWNGPAPPSSAPPLSVIQKHRQRVKSEPAESVASDPDTGADWTVFTQPDAPHLNAPTRPAFIQCVREWLEANLSTTELANLLV